MIHCLEFRRLATADPNYDDDSFRTHAAECESCGRFQAGMREFDVRLKKALEVPVPLDLALQQEMSDKPRPTPRPWLAAAATVVLSSALGFGLWLGLARHTLAEDVLAHMYNEPDLLLPAGELLDERTMVAVLNTIGADVAPAAGKFTHAGLCEFRGRLVAHLVLEGETGPVMVLLLPAEKLAEALEIDDDRFNGVVRTAGSGSIAVVGRDGERVENAARKIAAAVTFQTTG